MNTIPASDSLTDRYTALAAMQEIDSLEYAKAWLALAKDAAAQGRYALAGMCNARADWYGLQRPGEYLRLIEGSLSELILVEAVA